MLNFKTVFGISQLVLSITFSLMHIQLSLVSF